MKAITLHQPWASLIACGAKRIETRSWATKYRGPIAIHAGKTVPSMDLITPRIEKALWNQNTPFGKIIAIADLVDCVKIIGVVNGTMGPIQVPVYKAELENGETVRGDELFFGHYEIGRYAWILANIRRIDPVPAKGKQRLWNWEEERC